jgi:hypothetical protein
MVLMDTRTLEVKLLVTGCKSNAYILVWENVFFQVLSHQGESDCGSDVALPLHPAVMHHSQNPGPNSKFN